MSCENTDRLARLQVPHPNCAIVRSTDEDWEGRMRERLVELETHHAVGMALERHDIVSPSAPIALDFQSFRVDVFPWSCEGE